jgi:hypothetical protein
MFDKIIELFNKFQKIFFMVVIVFLIISLSSNGCQRKDFVKLAEKLTGIKLENEFLLKENLSRKEELFRIRTDSIFLRMKYDSLLTVRDKLIVRNKGYEKRISTLEGKIKEISEDSSYQWLQIVGYPFGGDYKPFGFNGPQVKAIHLDKVESLTKDTTINELGKELVLVDSLLYLANNMKSNESAKARQYEAANKNLELVSGNKDEIIVEKDKMIKKEKRGKNFWKVTTVVASTIAAVALIL